MEQFHDIYDRMAKRCLSLSSKSTVNIINGLYGTEHPDDSEVTYHWTEHTDEDLKRTLADTIITIGHTFSYHIEIQMTLDGSIVCRMFDYGYRVAVQTMDASGTLRFPAPKIIYLYEHEKAPDFYELTVDFGDQGSFLYRVPAFKYLEESIEELNRRKLKRMTLQLYHHIYDKYGEMEEAGVNDMVEEALILDIDIIEHEHRMELKAKEKEVEALVLDIDVIEKEHQEALKAKDKELLAMKLLLKHASDEDILAQTGLTWQQLEQLKA